MDLRGTSGSVTYAGAERTGGNLIENDIVGWGGRFEKSNPTRVTRPGSLMHRYSVGPIDGRGFFRVVVTDTTSTAMPIPLGVSASLVLLEASGITYTFNAMLISVRKAVDIANGSQQFAEYEWIGSSTNSTDTVTPG